MVMPMPVYRLTVRNRAAALVLTLAVLGAGAALLVVGLALLATLAVAGGVLGAGLLAYRALRGQRGAAVPPRRSTRGLDPALEVFPEPGALGRSRAVTPNDTPGTRQA
jgi:hypothetical protein